MADNGPWFEVRESTVGEGWKAIYRRDPNPLEGERLITVLRPGELEILRAALERKAERMDDGLKRLRYDGTDPELPGGWIHDDGTPCPAYLAPENGTRWWCTEHQQYLRRPQ